MRILILGGTGFIGPPVVRSLIRMGHEVAVFHRGATTVALPPAVRSITGDRHTLGEFRPDVQRFAPELVIDMILSNERQARELITTLSGIARRIVMISSIDVYRACGRLHRTEPGPPDSVPLTEESPLRSLPLYPAGTAAGLRRVFTWVADDYDKVPAERVIMSGEIAGTVLRLPMVYGPGDPLHRLFPIVKRVDDGRRAILLDQDVARWCGSRGYVENVGAAIALAAASERASGRIYNVAEPEAFSELEWTRRVAGAAGWRGDIVVTPPESTPAHLKFAGDARQHWSADSSRIRNELGYREEVPLEEALRRTIAWERANRPAQFDPAQFDYAAEDTA